MNDFFLQESDDAPVLALIMLQSLKRQKNTF